MILLTTPDDNLFTWLSQSNIPIEVQINYVDLNLQTRTQTPGRISKTITAAGDSLVCPGPQDYGISRAIKQMSIYNADPLQTLIVKIKHSGSDEESNTIKTVTQYAASLDAEKTLQYISGQGFFFKLNRGQTSGEEGITTTGDIQIGDFLRFTDNGSAVEGLTVDELKILLNIDGIEKTTNNEFRFDGNIVFESSTVPYTLDLGGGTIINGNVDGGSVDITP